MPDASRRYTVEARCDRVVKRKLYQEFNVGTFRVVDADCGRRRGLASVR